MDHRSPEASDVLLDPCLALEGGEVLCGCKDLEQARETVGEIFVDHRINAASSDCLRPIDVRCKRLESLALCYFDYGRHLEIEPEVFEDFYLLLVPVSGAANVKERGHTYLAPAGTGLILPAERKTSMVWSEETTKLVVRIDRRRLTAKLEGFLGYSLPRSPHFDLDAQNLSAGTNPLRQCLQGLIMLASQPAGPGRALMSAAIEDAFHGAVLASLPNDMSDVIADGAISGVSPKSVRRAEAFIDAHLTEPIRIRDLVRASGVSERSLFEGFKRFREMTPMQFVRFRRLHAVRDALAHAEPGVRVSQLAAEFGFAHFGRFATDYARQFGELPSETLRRSKG